MFPKIMKVMHGAVAGADAQFTGGGDGGSEVGFGGADRIDRIGVLRKQCGDGGGDRNDARDRPD